MKKFNISIAFIFLIAFTGNTAFSGDYSLVNKSGTAVTGVYVSSPGSSVWNRLPLPGTIGNGDKVLLSIQPSSDECTYSIKFTDSNGQEYLMDNVNICDVKEIILTANRSESVPKADIKLRNKN
jgi:hypothetical protein